MKQRKAGRVVIPRNPLVTQMRARSGGGVHGKSTKVQRRDAKLALRKKLSEGFPSCASDAVPAAFG